MTTMTFKNEDGVFEVTVDEQHMTVKEVITRLVRPTLLAAGYQPESIRQATGDYYHDGKEKKTRRITDATELEISPR